MKIQGCIVNKSHPPFKDKTTRDLAQWGGGPKTTKSKAIRAKRMAAMKKPPFKGKGNA